MLRLLSIGERANKKNIESLNLTWKVNVFWGFDMEKTSRSFKIEDLDILSSRKLYIYHLSIKIQKEHLMYYIHC